jgi:hypothetical protein
MSASFPEDSRYAACKKAAGRYDSILALQTLKRELEVRRGHPVQVLSRRPPQLHTCTSDFIVLIVLWYQ